MNYLSVREVAEVWEVSEVMIQKYCAQKRIPGAKQKGGVICFAMFFAKHRENRQWPED